MAIAVRIRGESNGHEVIKPGSDRIRDGSFAVSEETNAKAPRQRAFTLNGIPAHASDSTAARVLGWASDDIEFANVTRPRFRPQRVAARRPRFQPSARPRTPTVACRPRR